jgi:hypothetical protein
MSGAGPAPELLFVRRMLRGFVYGDPYIAIFVVLRPAEGLEHGIVFYLLALVMVDLPVSVLAG